MKGAIQELVNTGARLCSLNLDKNIFLKYLQETLKNCSQMC